MLRFWRRGRSGERSLPRDWREILARNVPLSRRLPPALRPVFEQHLRRFLDRTHFEGCGGLELTDAMRVTVAGHAALLLAGDPGGDYPQLGTVVIYPESFAAPVRTTDQTGVVTETVEERLGESWQEGTVILAWDSVEEVIGGRSGDCNVMIHEFAHQIDARHGLSAGAPLLAPGARYRDWDDLLAAELVRQRSTRRRGRPAVLDPYALTSAEELFAVASETFFMRPVRLQANHPELYAELQAVYGMDPAGWLTDSG